MKWNLSCTNYRSIFSFTVKVVGYEKDKIDTSITSDYYETLYSLLDNYSPLYRESFGQAVIEQLNQIKDTDSEQQ